MQGWAPLPGTCLEAVWTCSLGPEESEGQPTLPGSGEGVALLLEGQSLGSELGPALRVEPGQEVSDSVESPWAGARGQQDWQS